jgi:hypothetical protein
MSVGRGRFLPIQIWGHGLVQALLKLARVLGVQARRNADVRAEV